MEKDPKDKDKSLTSKDLVETLLLISETSKVLAQEIMLTPKDKPDKGGYKDGDKPDNT